MNRAAGGDDPAVVFQRMSTSKIEGGAIDVGYSSPRRSHQGHTGGVVPYLFSVIFLSGQAQVDGGVSPGDRRVFALAVYSVGGAVIPSLEAI